MGVYVNPGNSGFKEILQSEYVDKTGLIAMINSTIGTKKKLTCISRPRRFGKSYAAQMLCAYYDKTCDSSELFTGLEINKDNTYQKHLNKYDVIYLDMTQIMADSDRDDFITYAKEMISYELKEQYPAIQVDSSFSKTLDNTVAYTGDRFIMIIDEWDAPIREKPEKERQYLEFLRMLFKSSGFTSKVFAAAYITGILPIKKDGSQSAISDFREYTMLKPRAYGRYAGFTENEVKRLCEEHDVDFGLMKLWYDGYMFKDVEAVYNPNSVMQAIDNDDFDSYWVETSAAESLMKYISKDYNGLTQMIAELIGGIAVKVDTVGFANDLVTFRGKDDVLTLLIHLGYLTYNSEEETVRIPNEEIRKEFSRSVREVKHEATLKRIEESDRLFNDVINMNEEAVAAQIDKVHLEETAPINYNREDSLRSVIKLAFYAYKENYTQWEELPLGAGYADVVYIPKKDSGYPALVIELKWNDSAEGAIKQIRDRQYPTSLKDYIGDILLVGISYNKDDEPEKRKHKCRIEKA